MAQIWLVTFGMCSMRSLCIREVVTGSVLALSLACAEQDPDYLKVRGEARVELEGTESGFNFADDVLLDDDRVGRFDRIAGHCVISVGSAGEKDVVSVGLALPLDSVQQGQAVRRLTIRLEGLDARVSSMLGEIEFSGIGGGDQCGVSELYRQHDGGLLALGLDCEVSDGNGRTALARGELHFAGCETQ